MSIMRFLKSMINMALFIVNIILWVLDKPAVGEIVTGIEAAKNSDERLKYGLSAFLQWVLYFSIVGMIVTIYFWVKDEKSIAERISGVKQVEKKTTKK